MKINVNNGTLVIRKRDDGDYVQFAPHDPADMITKVSPVDYDPSAVAPEFEKFLARVQPNLEMRLFLQQWFGLSLTGDTSAHKLAFLYGKGRNGKSVLVNAVSTSLATMHKASRSRRFLMPVSRATEVRRHPIWRNCRAFDCCARRSLRRTPSLLRR
jgi:phage/plasmid-associated DNA primase